MTPVEDTQVAKAGRGCPWLHVSRKEQILRLASDFERQSLQRAFCMPEAQWSQPPRGTRPRLWKPARRLKQEGRSSVTQHRTVHRIVFCSPAGSTRHVAQVIQTALGSTESRTESLELWQGNQGQAFPTVPQDSDRYCLWIGTPVYALHAVPPIQEFLDHLPVCNSECYAVPFVTFGGVTSGTALEEMGARLQSKGYTLVAAAKILAVHSSLWKSPNPLGQGHPNSQDEAMIRDLVACVQERLRQSSPTGLDPDTLVYQPEAVRSRAAQMSIDAAIAAHPGFTVHPERCTQCGICQENCPAEAISLDPHPVFNTNCFLCHNCARLCPEEAITMDSQAAEERIRDLADFFAESPSNAIFT